MERRVVIQWTDTAKNQLAKLPKKVRRGLLDKAGELRNVADPRKVYKPLVGPLQGYYRITYGRCRAIYAVKEDHLPSGDVLVYVRVIFIAVGQRKERDRKDVYAIAKKLVDLGIIDVDKDETERPASSSGPEPPS